MIHQRSAISNQRSVTDDQRQEIVNVKRRAPEFSRKLPTIYRLVSANQKGFTLVELMISMVLFVLVIVASSQIFTALLTQFKQQSKIAETNIEGVIGLEMMRRDIESAGYGLPWAIPAAVAYNEATAAEAAAFNDCSGAAPCNPPRAVTSGNGMVFISPNDIFNGSDYLVVKAVNVAPSAAAHRWTTLRTGNVKRVWGVAADDFDATDRVIVISPGTTDPTRQSLISVGGAWWTTYNNTNPFAPDATDTETRFIYGIDPDTDLRMPFNRADYYIWRGGTSVADDRVPDRCAFNTGVLRKAVINQSAGTVVGGTLPLLDCVADMQAVFALDNDENGVFENGVGGDAYSNDLAGLTAEQIRRRVKEVRVYVLAHEGQFDSNFTFSGFTAGACATCVRVGLSNAFGRDFEFGASAITNWQNYRWKVYTLVVKPNNLR